MMHTAKVISIKNHRGSPRLWMQGTAPERSGFVPGNRFVVKPHGKGILLQLAVDGDRRVSKKVYASGKDAPVIDINSTDDLAPLAGMEAVRVVFGPGSVLVTPLASELRRRRRLVRLKSRLEQGEPLQTAAVAAGGGVLSHAVHQGLEDAGVTARVAVYNEIREDLTEHAAEHNDVVTAQTQLLAVPLQELAFDDEVLKRVGEVDVCELGLPCSGASVAGRAKRALQMPEQHPDVGHLVAAALALLAKLNPAVALFENVPSYQSSASAFIIRQQLRDMGYECHERELYGPDFGELEARTRWCLVAVTKGIEFDLDGLVPPASPPRTLADVLEPHQEVAARWSEMSGLKDKQIRDREAGKNFKMQVFDGSEATIGTLTKGISKNRSTDPKIQHPELPDLLRVPTAREHARCKGVPEHLIEGLSHTTAHELLGQGIVYGPFRALAGHIGQALRRWAAQEESDGFAATQFKAAA